MRSHRPQVGVVLRTQHHAGHLVENTRICKFSNGALYSSQMNAGSCDRVWRHRGERSSACNIVQHARFGSRSVMVRGGISLEGCTALHLLTSMTAIRYREEVLRPLVRPYAGEIGPGFLLM